MSAHNSSSSEQDHSQFITLNKNYQRDAHLGINYGQLAQKNGVAQHKRQLGLISQLLLIIYIGLSGFIFLSLILVPPFHSSWLSYGDRLTQFDYWSGVYYAVDIIYSYLGTLSWYFIINSLICNFIFLFIGSKKNLNLLTWLSWFICSIFVSISLGLIGIVSFSNTNPFEIGGMFANLISVLVKQNIVSLIIGILLFLMTIYFASIQPIYHLFYTTWHNYFSPLAREDRKRQKSNKEHILQTLQKLRHQHLTEKKDKRREKYLNHLSSMQQFYHQLRRKFFLTSTSVLGIKAYNTKHLTPIIRNYYIIKKLSTLYKIELEIEQEFQLELAISKDLRKKYYVVHNLQKIYRDQIRNNTNFMYQLNSQQIKQKLSSLEDRIKKLQQRGQKTGFQGFCYVIGEKLKDPFHRDEKLIKRLRDEYLVNKDLLYSSQALEQDFSEIDNLDLNQLATTELKQLNSIIDSNNELINKRNEHINKDSTLNDDSISADQQNNQQIKVDSYEFNYAYLFLKTFANPQLKSRIKHYRPTPQYLNYLNFFITNKHTEQPLKSAATIEINDYNYDQLPPLEDSINPDVELEQIISLPENPPSIAIEHKIHDPSYNLSNGITELTPVSLNNQVNNNLTLAPSFINNPYQKTNVTLSIINQDLTSKEFPSTQPLQHTIANNQELSTGYTSLFAESFHKLKVAKTKISTEFKTINFTRINVENQTFILHQQDQQVFEQLNNWLIRNQLDYSITAIIVDRTLARYELSPGEDADFELFNRLFIQRKANQFPFLVTLLQTESNNKQTLNFLVERKPYVFKFIDILNLLTDPDNNINNQFKYLLGNNLYKSYLKIDQDNNSQYQHHLNWLEIYQNNIYITGQAISGITSTLSQLIFSIAYLNHSAKVKLAIIAQDNNSKLKQFTRLPHLISPIMHTTENFLKLVDYLYAEYNNRKTNCYLAGVADIVDLNKSIIVNKDYIPSVIPFGKPFINNYQINLLPLIVVVIDNLNPHLTELRKNDLLSIFDNLIQYGPQFGIQFVIGDNHIYNTPSIDNFTAIISRFNSDDNINKLFEVNSYPRVYRKVDSWLKLNGHYNSIEANSIPTVDEQEISQLVASFSLAETQFIDYINYQPNLTLNLITEYVIEKGINKLKIGKDFKTDIKQLSSTLKKLGIVYNDPIDPGKEFIIDLASYLVQLPQFKNKLNYYKKSI